jgi:hypothetical protein
MIAAGRSRIRSTLVPVGISILRDELPGARLAPAVAMINATLGFGRMGLPLAVCCRLLGWQSIFWAPPQPIV